MTYCMHNFGHLFLVLKHVNSDFLFVCQIELHISRFPAGRGKFKCGKFPAGNSLRENAGMRGKIISQNWRFLTEFATKSLDKLLKFHV